MTYYDKYIKYKIKYINFKKQYGGGGNIRTQNINSQFIDFPLHSAVFNGNYSLVEQLLNGVININETAGETQTPLHIAAQYGHTEIAKLLLDKGAVVDPRDNDERTPLHYAVFNGQTEIARLLLDKGAVVDSKYKNGENLLHIAAKIEHYGTQIHSDIVSLLLEKIDIESKDDYEMTPLHHAVISGNKDIVELLLKNKANYKSQDKYGNIPDCYTLYDIIRNRKQGLRNTKEIMKLLKSNVNDQCNVVPNYWNY
jgi:ankyrin repeat protein